MKTLRIINKSKYQAEKKTPPSKKKTQTQRQQPKNCIGHHPWGIQMHVKTDLKNYQL